MAKDLSCPKCNSPNPPSAKFCYKCGARLPVAQTGSRTTLSPSKSRLQFWLGTLVYGVFLVLLVGFALWFLVRQNNAIIDFSPELSAVRNFDKAEFTFSGRVSDRDVQRLLPVAQSYSNPALRTEKKEPVRPEVLLVNPSRYANRTVIVNGKLSRKAEVESLFENDWQTAYVLGIWSNGQEIPVIYRGDAKRLKAGDFVQVEGVFIEDGKGIHADKVTRLDADPQALVWEQIWLLRASIAVFLWLIFCTSFFLWRAFRKNWFSRSLLTPSILFLFMSGTVSACSMDITTIIQADGSGVMTTSFARSKQDIDFLRQAPGMASYLDSWIMNLRQEGMLAENYLYGDQEAFFLQRQFGNLEELSVAQATETTSSWTYVTKYVEGSNLIFRVVALIDTSILYSNLNAMNPTAAGEIQKELDSSHMSYSFILPGELAYHNGKSGNKNRITWTLRLNDKNQLVAESQLPIVISPDNQVLLRGKIIENLVMIFVASSLVLILGLLRYRVPNRREN